ncbi:hypothetical protein H8E50_04230 [bacterium]|nr:hypothetical protein [bacterium]
MIKKGALIIALFSLFLSAQTFAQGLEGELQKYMTGGEYLIPQAGNVSEAEELFLGLFNSGPAEISINKLAVLGFEYLTATEGGREYYIIGEREEFRQGRGVYVVADSPELPVLIQVPHSFSDFDTDRIGMKLFRSGLFSAAAWNTLPRHAVSESESYDLAHEAVSYFNAFGKAFVKFRPYGYVLQLHGFNSNNRKTGAGRRAGMIVSDGTASPSDKLIRLTRCLQMKMDYPVYIYPYQVQELGATTNEQGKALRALGNEGFVHLEMSREARRGLLDKNKDMEGFSACLMRYLR